MRGVDCRLWILAASSLLFIGAGAIDKQAVSQWLLKAAEATDKVQPTFLQAAVLARVGVAQAEAKDVRNAQHTLQRVLKLAPGVFDHREASRSGARTSLIGDIARIQAGTGKPGQARMTLDRAAEVAALPEDPSDRAEVLISIASAELDAGFKDMSRRRLADAVAAAQKIKAQAQRGRLLNVIAAAQARAGDVDAAVRLAQSTALEGYAAWSMPTIARALAAKGEPDRARALLADYRLAAHGLINLFRTQALIEIATAECENKDFDAARDTLKEVAGGIDGERNPAYRLSLLCKAAMLRQELGEADAAHDTLADARRVARTVADARDRAFKWIEIAHADAAIKDQASAAAALTEALASTAAAGPADRGYLIGKIAEAQAACGDLPAAIRTAGNPRVTGRSRVEALIAIARAAGGVGMH